MKENDTRSAGICSAIPFAIMAAIIVLFIILTKGTILSPLNLEPFFERTAVLIICASGMLFVIAQGSIDMAAGSVVGFVGTFSCMFADRYGFALLFPTAICLGALIGLATGFVVTRAKVSSFLTTLCLGVVLRAVMGMMLSTTSYLAGKSIKALMQPYILIPILIGICLLCFYLFERTPFGFRLRSIGENEVASAYAGVKTALVRTMGFVVSGALSGIAGVLTVSRLGNATNTTGTMFELQTMIAIFLGGVLVSGGRSARYHKVLLGCITYMFLDNGMSILRVNNLLNQCIRGVILIAIVAVTALCDRVQNRRSGNKMSVTL